MFFTRTQCSFCECIELICRDFVGVDLEYKGMFAKTVLVPQKYSEWKPFVFSILIPRESQALDKYMIYI